MQEQSNVEKKLNDYFDLARNEAPIVSSEEVAHVITNMSISNSNKFNWKFHSTWLAVVGLSITIYTAYFLNQNNLESKKSNNKEPKNTELISGESQTTSLANPPVDSSFSNATINNTLQQNKVDVVTENNNSNSTKIENKKESFFFQGSAKVNFEEDGKNIEMMINNENIQLKIDGNIIDPENYNQYNSIIEKGKLLKEESDNLNDKTTSQTNIEKERNKQTMNEIISQLEKDQIIDPSSHFEFRLTGTKMLINEVEQSEILFNKYKLLYESASGNRLNMKSNIKIKH